MKLILLPLIIALILFASCENPKNKVSTEVIQNKSAEKLFKQAEYFDRIGIQDSALIYYYEANRAETNNPLILYKRGLILLKYNEFGPALLDLDQSISLTKDDELKKLRNQKRTSILLKMGINSKSISEISYFSINDTLRQSKLFRSEFSKDAFTNGGLKKGSDITLRYEPAEGMFNELIRNSKIFLTPSNSNFDINKSVDNTFNIFIPEIYNDETISYDISIAPNPGFNIVTYYSNKIISYPDTIGFSQISFLVHNK